MSSFVEQLTCRWGWKLIPGGVRTVTKKNFLFFNVGEEVKIKDYTVKLGTDDMESIRNTYMRYKALVSISTKWRLFQKLACLQNFSSFKKTI